MYYLHNRGNHLLFPSLFLFSCSFYLLHNYLNYFKCISFCFRFISLTLFPPLNIYTQSKHALRCTPMLLIVYRILIALVLFGFLNSDEAFFDLMQCLIIKFISVLLHLLLDLFSLSIFAK